MYFSPRISFNFKNIIFPSEGALFTSNAPKFDDYICNYCTRSNENLSKYAYFNPSTDFKLMNVNGNIRLSPESRYCVDFYLTISIKRAL